MTWPIASAPTPWELLGTNLPEGSIAPPPANDIIRPGGFGDLLVFGTGPQLVVEPNDPIAVGGFGDLLTFGTGPAVVERQAIHPGGFGDLLVFGPGPLVTAPFTLTHEITATLVGHGALTTSFDRSFQEATSDPGAGELRIPHGDPALAGLDYGNLIRFAVDGQTRFTMRVEELDGETASPAEEVGQFVTVRGRSLLAEWQRANVQPPNGAGANPFADLLVFNWAHPQVVITAWPFAHQQWPQGIGAAGYAAATNLRRKVNTPLGWPDPGSWWIWGRPAGGSPPAQDPGDCYFAREITVASDTPVSIYVAGDDAFELWVDGIPVGANRELNGWQDTYRADTILSAGTHRFAAKVTNFVRTSTATNVAGFICAVYAQDGDGNDTTLLTRSDAGWRTLPYPTVVPGFTDGQIIRLLLDDAQAASQLTGWGLSFTDLNDSAGNPWPVRPETTFRVGDDLLKALEQLGESNIEFAADRVTRTLHAWNSGGRGRTGPVATLAAGVNLNRAAHRGQG